MSLRGDPNAYKLQL
jgi:hypothetical protein